MWFSFELQIAVEKGYLIAHTDGEGVAFPKQNRYIVQGICQYILKCKQEASGYPGHVKTPEEKERYIDEHFKNIQLDANNLSTRQ